MELLSKIEHKILDWLKGLPHLPVVARKWLADNIWWITIIGLIVLSISALAVLFGTLLSSAATAYILPAFAAWQKLTGTVTFIFTALLIVVMAFAIKPLQNKEKKGWVLLFAFWLLTIIWTVADAILSLNVLEVITDILFGAIWIALSGYFLFEIHGQFAHVRKSAGVKASK